MVEASIWGEVMSNNEIDQLQNEIEKLQKQINNKKYKKYHVNDLVRMTHGCEGASKDAIYLVTQVEDLENNLQILSLVMHFIDTNRYISSIGFLTSSSAVNSDGLEPILWVGKSISMNGPGAQAYNSREVANE